MNPEKNDDCPDPKTNSGSGYIGIVAGNGYVSEWLEYFVPWVNSQNMTPVVYENMFQHFDANDSAHRVWHQDPYWLMNLNDKNWAEYVTATTLGWMFDSENEGCFFDVSVETNVSLYNPKSSNPAPGNFNWWELPHKPTNAGIEITDRNAFALWMNGSFRQYFQNIYSLYHQDPEIYLIIPNVDQMATTVYDPVWLQGNGLGETVDGAMMENFGGYRGSDMYLSLERGFRHLTQRNKILITQFSASTPEERLRRTAMQMLIKNDVTFMNIINTGKVEWYPEYEIDLGRYVTLPETFGEMIVKGEGNAALWKRVYDSGAVVCNTSDTAFDYNPYGEGWTYIKTSGGGEINDDGTIKPQSINYVPFKGSISVKPSECLILRKFDAIDGVEDFNTENDFDLYPNPVEQNCNLSINLNQPQNISIAVTDVLGNQVKKFNFNGLSIGKNVVTLQISDLSPGIYTCKISGENIYKVVKLIKK